MTSSRSLAGLTVVVTRPQLRDDGQEDELVALLGTEGARVVVMPLIALVDVASDRDVREAMDRVDDRGWVIVASAHAGRRVAPFLDATTARVAAVGLTTARALPRVDLVAKTQSAAGLVADFPAGEATVVVVQAADGASTLVDGLTQLGWTVHRLDTHRSVPVVPDARQQLAVLHADAVVFTSGSQAESWTQVFGDAAPPLVVTIGPQTTQKVEQSGLKVAVTAADHSLPGVITALQDLVKGRAGG